MAERLTLNVVYTPGTVAPLQFMFKSLLYWSDCEFCLVSNGCLPPEDRFLEGLAKQNKRVSYLKLPCENIWPHGDALNYLFRHSSAERFGFIDSDIFASDEFLTPLLGALEGCSAVFSGSPVWASQDDQVLRNGFKLASGPYTRTQSGKCIGCTYFAIYKRADIAGFIDQSGIGFCEVDRQDLPPSVWRELEDAGLGFKCYDTGKFLNVMLLLSGGRTHYLNSDKLTHIGGYSFLTISPRWHAGHRGAWSARSLFRPLKSRLQTVFRYCKSGLTREEFIYELELRKEQRDKVRQFFWVLINALDKGEPLPKLPQLASVEINSRLQRARDELVESHRVFS